MNILLIFIYFIILFYYYNKYYKINEVINPFFLFSIFHFIYNVGIPIEMIIMNDYTLRGMVLGYDNCTKLMIMSILSLIGFAQGFSYSWKIWFFNSKTNDSNLYVIMFLTFFTIVLLFFHSGVLASGTYEGNVDISAGNPSYKYLIELTQFYYVVMISYIFNKNQSIIKLILFLLPLIYWGVYSSDKNPILLAGIPLVLLLYKLKYFNSSPIINVFLLFLVILIIPLLIMKFSLYRADTTETLYDYLRSSGLYKSIDARGPMKSLIILLNLDTIDYEYGQTYIKSLFQWIPRSIWKNRPLDLAQEFAIKHVPNWKPGKGYGYSLLAESYLNFGILGSFIQYYLIGYLLTIFSKMIDKIIKNEKESSFLNYVLIVFNVALMHRASFILPTLYIRYLIPLFFFLMFIKNIRIFKRKILIQSPIFKFIKFIKFK
ncbi:O-antigen polysaccharide polymerase Wzy [bacterium]|nr:O-antigen polysaccharide polymerase Wzy [bacterium]